MRVFLACLLGLIVAFAADPAAARRLRIVALGDSLTAGFLLPAQAAFPAVLEQALKARGRDVEIVNAGVSGDTTAGGLARVDWSVPDGTDGVLLELGANDALRGLDPAAAERHLDEIITRLKARKIKVLLIGMQAPRNMGPDYAARFDAIYPRLAKRHGLLLDPFFLTDVAGDRSLNLIDGMHPNAEGVRRIVTRILPRVESFLSMISGRS